MNLILHTDNQLQRIESIKDCYTVHAKTFINFLKRTGQAINEDSIRQYFTELNGSKYKAGTIRAKRTAVRARVRMLFKNEAPEVRAKLEQVLNDINAEVKAPKKNQSGITADRVLNKDSYNELLKACGSNRQKAFIMFLWATGARVNEMTTTELRNCKLENGHYKITVMGKGSKERDLFLQVDTFNFIRETFKGEKYLFETERSNNKKRPGGKKYYNPYVTTEIKKVGKRINRHLSAHNLRHSYATNLIKMYPDKIKEISLSMGHADISTCINYYLKVSLSPEEIFKHAAA